MGSSDRRFKLLGLFIVALLLFNFPLLQLFSGTSRLLGIPVIYWYIFLSWITIIALTARLVERRNSKKKK
ncbi:MAG: hypothetical protein MI974_02215 [Chitinophagales bacterium]|nr:hypothetical protein [Chitinophagales bacterium]